MMIASICAALVWSSVPLSGVAHAQDDEQKEVAVGLYKLAVADFRNGDYQEALRKLKEVYKLDPNPIILYNIGRAYEELGQLADAADYFQQAATDEALPENLQAEIGRRLPKVLPALTVRQAFAVSSRTVALGVRQGEERQREAFIDANNETNDPVDPGPTPLLEDPLLWTSVGLGVVGLGLVGGGLAVDLGLSDEIDELKQEETRADRARTLTLQDDIESGQTSAMILYISGGLAIAAGGALLTYTLNARSEAAPGEAPVTEEAGVGLRWSPIVGDDIVGLTIGGSLP